MTKNGNFKIHKIQHDIISEIEIIILIFIFFKEIAFYKIFNNMSHKYADPPKKNFFSKNAFLDFRRIVNIFAYYENV